jgi:AraC-like DNA-binding protein
VKVEKLTTRRPHQLLESYVDLLWHYEVCGQQIVRDHVLPHGAFELVFSINAPQSEAIVSGPQTRPMLIEPGTGRSLAGVHFRPGGAARLLRESARLFQNRDVPLVDIWPHSVRMIHDRLQQARSPHIALDTLETMLTQQLVRSTELHPAVKLGIDAIHQPVHYSSIAELVARTGLSHRRFNELFTDAIGLSPKLYARVQRFQRVLKHVSHAERVDWPALALDCGFSDQAHMIREFRSFSGMSPTAYSPRMPDQPNHVSAP